MRYLKCFTIIFLLFFAPASICQAVEKMAPQAAKQIKAEHVDGDTPTALASILELQKNLEQQINASREKLEATSSEAEKEIIEQEIQDLDRQLSESSGDFERIATGVETSIFAPKADQHFSWNEEMASLLEPAIKELKRFTVRARQKTDLKEKIAELETLEHNAQQAIQHLELVLQNADDKAISSQLRELLPKWKNTGERLAAKLDLARSELSDLQSQEVSLVEASSKSVRDFLRARGLYLLLALAAFGATLVGSRLLYRLGNMAARKFSDQSKRRSFQVRLFQILYQVMSVVLAVGSLFFVLYLAGDWFLLSMAIIFLTALAWTVRQTVPRMWQQGRLMLNIGAVRENERIILHELPWKVVSINVFCTLHNPALDVTLRLPIENLTGHVSRPYDPDESWFPCRKGDWVDVDGTRAKVVSLSHEQVELVVVGGARLLYPTSSFVAACPVNLSRNFRIIVPFGVSYALQARATSAIPVILKKYIEEKMVEEGYMEKCLDLLVDFKLANSSSLDYLILADFAGELAEKGKKIERSIQRWCVDCCTLNNWEIPFPQLTVHRAAETDSRSAVSEVQARLGELAVECN